MSGLHDVGGRPLARRSILRGVGALVPGLVIAGASAGTARADSASGRAATVHGAFSAPGYGWAATASGAQAGEPAPGVAFALTSDGRPLAGRRVRFSISSFETAQRSVWFEVDPDHAGAPRFGYLDLDVDHDGRVVLDRWLRRGAVPTSTAVRQPVLRAQLVGTETLLADVPLSVG